LPRVVLAGHLPGLATIKPTNKTPISEYQFLLIFFRSLAICLSQQINLTNGLIRNLSASSKNQNKD